jgi:hypothetical protein
MANPLLLGNDCVQTSGETEHTRSRDGRKEDLINDESDGG